MRISTIDPASSRTQRKNDSEKACRRSSQVVKVTVDLRRRTDTERVSEWRNETVPLRAHQASPLLHDSVGPRDWSGASVTSGRLVEENPFALSTCPLSLLDSSNPSQASIIVSYDYSLPRHPFTSFVSLAPGLSDNSMEPIRWFEEHGLTPSRLVRAIFNNYFDTPIQHFEGGFIASNVCRIRSNKILRRKQ